MDQPNEVEDENQNENRKGEENERPAPQMDMSIKEEPTWEEEDSDSEQTADSESQMDESSAEVKQEPSSPPRQWVSGDQIGYAGNTDDDGAGDRRDAVIDDAEIHDPKIDEDTEIDEDSDLDSDPGPEVKEEASTPPHQWMAGFQAAYEATLQSFASNMAAEGAASSDREPRPPVSIPPEWIMGFQAQYAANLQRQASAAGGSGAGEDVKPELPIISPQQWLSGLKANCENEYGKDYLSAFQRELQRVQNIGLMEATSDLASDEELDSNGIKRKKIDRPKKRDAERAFICDICQAGFMTLHTLNSHKIVHSDERPFKCDDCEKCFARTGDLKVHVRQVHSKVKPFACPTCGFQFARRGSLHRHLAVHREEKPFQCEECFKTFKRNSDLRLHRKTHFEERAYPYECEVCKKKFSNVGNLKHHMWIHTGEKCYQCEKCDASFASSKAIKKHMMRRHAETGVRPVCDRCIMSIGSNNDIAPVFTFSADGKRQRSFHCPACDRPFTKTFALKRHMNTHRTAAFEYICTICNEVSYSAPSQPATASSSSSSSSAVKHPELVEDMPQSSQDNAVHVKQEVEEAGLSQDTTSNSQDSASTSTSSIPRLSQVVFPNMELKQAVFTPPKASS